MADPFFVVHHDNQNDTLDPGNPTANLWRYPATARHIIDGDTLDAIIDLGFGIRITERLRFANIQAPAIIGIPADAPEYIRGMKAKQFIEQRLTANNNRLQISTSKQGKWRRWLATIYLADNTAGTTLNQELIDNQLADDWRTYQKRQQARAVVRTQFDIDRSLKSKLETHAKQQEISMTQLIQQALEQFIRT